MDDLYKQSSMIKAEALKIGFDGCGISKAEKLEDDSARLSDWLNNGFHATMQYMENHFDKRVDPSRLVEGAKSVISVVLNYYPSEKQQDPEAPVISKYAYGRDYHDVIRPRLRQLHDFINTHIATTNGRGFTDSAPVLERAWAARSGLGWIGKNSMLINPSAGSFFFIGVLILDIELYYDRPIPDFCGDCTRCLHACPTGAILDTRTIDSVKCISYQTIENRGEIDISLKGKFNNRVFGCDICQDVCPWNRKAIPHQTGELKPVPGLLEMKKEDWQAMDEEKYSKMFSQSAVKRAKYRGIRRNLDFIKDSPTNSY